MDVTNSLDWNAVLPDPIFTDIFHRINHGRLRDGRAVAIKSPGISWSRERMPKVLDIWAKCNHPNIVQLIGQVAFQGLPAAVYTWHEYISIRDYLECYPTADRYQLSAQICEGVAYLHANDIIHGRLSSEQIPVSSEGVPRIQLSVFTSSSSVIMDGNAGYWSAPWMAPELFKLGSKRTLASDVYELGMTILETITREIPYGDDSDIFSIKRKVEEGELPPRPTDTIPNNDAGNAIWDILCECWSFDPQDRASAKDVRNVMRTVYQVQDGVALKVPRLVVTEKTTIWDLVMHYEQHRLRNYTDLLQQAGIAVAIPLFDAALANVFKVALSDKQCVAVKCVKHVTPHKKLKRAARELSCWSSHEHENILPVLGFAVVRGDLAMVSPWMSNGYVTEYVARNLNCDRLGLCIQLARAIAYLHEHNVVHGDIKGPNVLISDEGMIQVTDFGVSVMDHQEIEFSSTFTRGGTQRWLAPEILHGRTDSTKEADIYALSMTMIEIYTGEQPYGPVTWFEVMTSVINYELRPARPIRLPIDITGNRVWGLITRCWAGDPSNRPTASEVYNRLRRLVSG